MIKSKKVRKYCSIITASSLIFAGVAYLNPLRQSKAADFDYSKALNYSIQFYDANKCGADAGENNAFSWRGACHENDGKDVGLDLSGGYHDCGDHVKFGITQGYAASVLGWSLYEYNDAFEQTGAKEKMMQTVRHFCDYFMKCHPTKDVFYYQLGDGNEDHAYWGAPEDQGDRATMFKVGQGGGAGADVTGEAAAALALMYLNCKADDPTYANKCLDAAKSIYALGKANPGLSQGQSFYTSSSYKDDLAWGASWLYKATGEESYLADAKECMQDKNGCVQDEWTMCWDDMNTPAAIQLYKLTNDSIYLDAVKHNMDYWMNTLKTTAGGLKYLNNWGVLRYSSAASMIAMQYYGMTGNESAKKLAVSQINYILGDNPNSMSYMIGYGNKYPTHPHHRAANGYTYADSGNLKPAKNLLVGALVGGPNDNDQYSDNGSDYVYTEVGIDYNAGLVGAIAALITENNGGSIATPTTKPTVAPTTKPTTAPTVAPTTKPTTAPTQKPTATPVVTGGPVSGVMADVEVKTNISNSVSQQYVVKATGSNPVELSKLAIRFNYSKNGTKKDIFWCDSAGLQLNKAPWYVNMGDNVNGTFQNGYLEITFDTDATLEPNTGSLTLGVRLSQEGWENYSNFTEGGIEVYYNGTLLK